MIHHAIAKSVSRMLAAGHPMRTVTYSQRLAAFIRSHGFPCRVEVGRKSGKVKLRAAMIVGYDTTKIRESQRRNWRIEMIEPNMTAVREWLGY